MKHFLILIFLTGAIMSIKAQRVYYQTKEEAQKQSSIQGRAYSKQNKERFPLQTTQLDTIACKYNGKVVRPILIDPSPVQSTSNNDEKPESVFYFFQEDEITGLNRTQLLGNGARPNMVECRCKDTMATFRVFDWRGKQSFFYSFLFTNGQWTFNGFFSTTARVDNTTGHLRGGMTRLNFSKDEKLVAVDSVVYSQYSYTVPYKMIESDENGYYIGEKINVVDKEVGIKINFGQKPDDDIKILIDPSKF